jgi:hypothetical protein
VLKNRFDHPPVPLPGQEGGKDYIWGTPPDPGHRGRPLRRGTLSGLSFFITLLGYIDDLILIPAGIYLTERMIPREVLAEYRQRTKLETIPGKSKWIAAVIIISLWMLVLYLILESIM